MRLLYITSKPGYPAIDGGCVAIQRFLDALLRGNHDITHLTFDTHKHPLHHEAWPEEIKKSIDLQSVRIDTRIKPFSLLTKTLGGVSYHLSRYRTPELKKKINELLNAKSFDAIILDGLYSAGCLDEIRLNSRSKIYIRTHNVEHEIWKTLAKNSKSSIRSFIIRVLTKALKKDEISLLNAVDGIFSISTEDSKKFIKLGIKTPITEIPVSIDQDEPIIKSAENHFFFIGGMDWAPNKEAADLLITSIFPRIKAQLPNAQLTIAGKGTGKLIAGEGISCLGFVPDSIQFMRNSGILLLPLQSGSGVRIKLLEAMSIGVPIVTTNIGKEGIACSGCMSVGDSIDDFISEVIALNCNDELKEKYSRIAKSYIKENYAPAKVAKDLNESL